MRYPRHAFLALILTLVCGWTAARLAAQEAGGPDNPFEGKTLLVYKKSDPEFTLSLEKARVATIGENSFLVERGAEDGDEENWQAGRTIWVALSDVSEINVFDSIEELQEVKGGMLGLKVAATRAIRNR